MLDLLLLDSKTMKQMLFTYLLFSLTIVCNSQTIERIKELEKSGYYTEAIVGYNKLLNYNLPKEQLLAINKRLLFTYIKTFNYSKAYSIYNSNSFTNLSEKENYSIFQLLRSVGEYETARTLFDSTNLDRKLFEKKFIDWPLNQKETANNVYLTNIDHIQQCHGIAFYKGGILVPTTITSSNKTAPYDIYYYQQLTDTTFTIKGNQFLPNKGNFYRGTPFYDSLTNTLIYSSNNSEHKTYSENKKVKQSISDIGKNNLQLLSYDIEKDITTPLFKNNKEISIHTPFIYKDSILFFSSTTVESERKSDIYYAIKQKNNWRSPQLLKGVNTFENDVYPYMIRNNFYFSSRGLAGFGGLDIYEGKLAIDSLGGLFVKEVKNMGKNINSTSDDFAFIINKAGQAFLASNRNATNGEDRIYTTNYFKSISIKGQVFSNNKPIQNIEVKPIADKTSTSTDSTSTKGNWELNIIETDSIQISFSGKGYYKKIVTLSSPSLGTNYVIQLKEKPNSFQLNNSITNQPITNASITIYEKEEPNGWIKKELVTTNKNGEWSFDFDVEKKYKVTVEAKNFQKKEIYIPKEDREIDNADFFAAISPLSLAPKAEGTLTINNIYFDYNSAAITNASIPILDNLIIYLKENKGSKIELSAHTDCIGGNDFNLKLSDNRAQSCLTYLLKNNINNNQVIARGYGEEHLINLCDEQRKDETKAKLNRRIEVKFID